MTELTALCQNKDGFPSFCRDNAWSLQPRSGPDHPCVCLPGSDGCSVLFRGPAHQGQEQTQAQETPHQTSHVPPAAADDRWEKPHSLTWTAFWNCCWTAGFTSKTESLLKGQLCVEQQHQRCGITESNELLWQTRGCWTFSNSTLLGVNVTRLQLSVGT